MCPPETPKDRVTVTLDLDDEAIQLVIDYSDEKDIGFSRALEEIVLKGLELMDLPEEEEENAPEETEDN